MGFVLNRPTDQVDPFGMWTYSGGQGTFSGNLSPLLLSGFSFIEKLPYTMALGSTMKLAYSDQSHPKNDSCESCEMIKFVQIYYANYLAHGTISSWEVDAEVHPYYGYQIGGPGYASMDDMPHWKVATFPRAPYFEAETCAVRTKGQSAGTVLGCVTWGHEYRYFKVPSFAGGAQLSLVTNRLSDSVLLVKRHIDDFTNPGTGYYIPLGPRSGIYAKSGKENAITPWERDSNVTSATVSVRRHLGSYPSQEMQSLILNRFFVGNNAP